MPRMRDVVLFDLDGTVQDTHNAILVSMRYATEKVMGRALPDDVLLAEVGQPLVTQMRTFARGDEELAQKLVVTYRGYNEKGLNDNAPLFPGIEEVLRRLNEQGFTVAVVTSKRRELARGSLEYFGLMQYLAGLFGLEDSEGHKPDPDPLIQAAKRLGVSLERCLYVGDSPFDLQAAHAAGIPCVGVTWGKFFGREALAPEKPEALVDAMSELLPAIRELAG